MSERGPFQDKPSIRVESLSISRGGRRLFEKLSFAAASGGYVEVQGSNGSGKTSLLRAIAGFLKPDSGTIRIEGAEESALALHYVGHANALKREDSVGGHLRYWAGLLGGEASAEAAAAILDLTAALSLPVRALSQGQARRLALSRLVIASRPIWLLDEPASSLDAFGKEILSRLIASHRAEGGLVIAAVHDPLEANPSLALRLGA